MHFIEPIDRANGYSSLWLVGYNLFGSHMTYPGMNCVDFYGTTDGKCSRLYGPIVVIWETKSLHCFKYLVLLLVSSLFIALVNMGAFLFS